MKPDIASLLDEILVTGEAPDADKEPETPAPVTEEPAPEPEALSSEPETPAPEPEPEPTPDPEPEVTTVVKEAPAFEFSKEVKEAGVTLPEFTTDELMESIDVRNFGTLSTLTNRRWHAKRLDKKAAADAAAAAGAKADAFESRKKLLHGADEKLKAVHSCIDAARTAHYGMTLPWSTIGVNDFGKRQGPRLLPNTSFFDYVKVLGKHKADMEAALDEFVDLYPSLVAIAQQNLGTSFDATEYPSVDRIRDYFALEFDFEPIPVGADFKGLQTAQAEKLSETLQKKTRQRLENAMQDLWSRVWEDVTKAARVFSDPNASFQYTLIDKLRAHAKEIASQNVLGDSRLEAIRFEIDKHLTAYDADAIRKDDALRKRLGEEATKIVTMMEGHV